MRVISTSLSSRNSCALPTRQPAFSRRSFLSFFTQPPLSLVVSLQSSPAGVLHKLWRASIFFREHLQNHDRITVDSIYDSPGGAFIDDSQLVTPGGNRRHRARMRQRDVQASLERSEQEAGLLSRLRRKWRCLYF